jgi:hypothetical protein
VGKTLTRNNVILTSQSVTDKQTKWAYANGPIPSGLGQGVSEINFTMLQVSSGASLMASSAVVGGIQGIESPV